MLWHLTARVALKTDQNVNVNKYHFIRLAYSTNEVHFHFSTHLANVLSFCFYESIYSWSNNVIGISRIIAPTSFSKNLICYGSRHDDLVIAPHRRLPFALGKARPFPDVTKQDGRFCCLLFPVKFEYYLLPSAYLYDKHNP